MRNDIMGVLFDNLTLAEAVDAGERLAAARPFAYVVTPNRRSSTWPGSGRTTARSSTAPGWSSPTASG